MEEQREEVPREETYSDDVETKHEPHEHASKRLILGIIAVIAVFVLGGIVWTYWGDAIEEACFGDQGACTVDIDITSAEETVFPVTFELNEDESEY